MSFVKLVSLKHEIGLTRNNLTVPTRVLAYKELVLGRIHLNIASYGFIYWYDSPQ